ncbi:carbohydrate kinase family protein [Echinimonas agarilytica]|uniref:PfkB family carbohydrate kinase n=1 Tax=Echinimonas agarilytica TaxID=1215918 RepID=A0AA41W3U8_9GAMM|nr:PfkB family carbohydrate kinase [Echinimonas agarilytica]MCM2678304.1 PfkB family carbohydrate kinase [Echinimonas agarilytica]
MRPEQTSVFVAGGASWDAIIDLDVLPHNQPESLFAKRYHEAVGGTGAGKALNLEKLGFNVMLHVVLGQDEWGDKIQQRFQRTGVQLLTDIDPNGTERHTNLMDADGRRISIFTHSASPIPGIDPEHLARAMRHADYVVINIINYCRRLLPYARELGKPVWCDLHDYDGKNSYHSDFVAAADYIFMSDDKLDNPRSLMESLVDAGKQLVVCTHGKRGASALTHDGQWFAVSALTDLFINDCNGAGDAFFAGYLFGHQQGLSVLDCLRVGTKVAARCISSDELVDTTLTEQIALSGY